MTTLISLVWINSLIDSDYSCFEKDYNIPTLEDRQYNATKNLLRLQWKISHCKDGMRYASGNEEFMMTKNIIESAKRDVEWAKENIPEWDSWVKEWGNL